MILSRYLARQRIAAGQRPGFLAAYWPVLGDAAAIVAALSLTWGPMMRFIEGAALGTGFTFVLMFVVYFIPLQAVIIVSSMWAARSRWRDDADR